MFPDPVAAISLLPSGLAFFLFLFSIRDSLLSYILERLSEFGIAHVLLTSHMLFDSCLCVVDDQKRSADFAHLHYFLVDQLTVLLGLILQVFALGFEFVAGLELGLGLVYLAQLSQ